MRYVLMAIAEYNEKAELYFLWDLTLFIQVARFESRVNPTDIPMATMSNSNGSTMQINTRPDDIRKRIIGCEFSLFIKIKTKLKW